MKDFLCLILLVIPCLSSGQSLPVPSGKYPVGVRSFFMSDYSRTDSARRQHRLISVTVWYPSAADLKVKALYIPEGLLKGLENGYSNLDSLTLHRLAALRSNSSPAAAPFNSKFPVVFFSPGWGMAAFSYTTLIEDLVSSGVVVIAMDNLYCGPVRLPDGKIVSQKDYPYDNYIPYLIAATEDLRFLMNSVKQGLGELKFLRKIADTSNVGAMGHSIGGNVALLAAQDPQALRFAINLDGGAFENIGDGVSKIPTLTIRSFPQYTDAELASRGRSRKAWNDMGNEIDSVFAANLGNTKSTAFEVKLKGTGHMSFSDAPFLMPEMLSRFGGTYLSPEETRRQVTHLIMEMMGAAARGKFKKFARNLPAPRREVRLVGM